MVYKQIVSQVALELYTLKPNPKPNPSLRPYTFPNPRPVVPNLSLENPCTVPVAPGALGLQRTASVQGFKTVDYGVFNQGLEEKPRYDDVFRSFSHHQFVLKTLTEPEFLKLQILLEKTELVGNGGVPAAVLNISEHFTEREK